MTLGPYELGKVHLGDCLELMKALPDKCVDLVLTDPPYGLNNCFGRQQLKNGRKFLNDSPEDFVKLMPSVIEQMKRVCKDGAVICMFAAGGGAKLNHISSLFNLRRLSLCGMRSFGISAGLVWGLTTDTNMRECSCLQTAVSSCLMMTR